ncbi:MAG: ASKHA domain-containing protein [Clostridiales Family XIII bacterium]|jgi:uncharacterized 2Fe-2S/4Fe-4S cluster protein (DUF4445 family)|nr:ASKHA domain-containing protein [Clostridiales Family XIII bacterium]
MAEKEYRIVFRPENGAEHEAYAREGATLLSVARSAGVAIDAPCGGAGTCGKCKVRLVSGDVASARGRHISEEDFASGYRLACESSVIADAYVFVPASALAWQSQIRVDISDSESSREKIDRIRRGFADAGFAVDGGVRNVRALLTPPSLDDAEADRERLLRALGGSASSISLHALRKLPTALRDGGFSVDCLVLGGGAVIDVGNEAMRPVGVAIDIGTTTVSALAVDLDTGEVLSAGSAGNGQIRYGADVINRLIESARPGGAERLRKAIAYECLAPLTANICESAGVEPSRVARLSIAGNTTMMHLLLGVFGNHLRMEPYVPAFFSACGLTGADIDIGVNPGAEVFVAPSVGSYVGGDITAGALASGIYRTALGMDGGGEGASLFIDLGTNGEIALSGEGFLMSCACSAGPAFEGGDIRCGMRAMDGAIEAVRIDADTMAPDLSVIGGAEPIGICGSGLIDLIGELFRCRIIDARGKFVRDGDRIGVDEWDDGKYYVLARGDDDAPDIILSEVDIDNFIRAKGSVYSAIRTMLEVTGMEAGDLGRVFIAGGIGSAIDITSAIRIGMLPSLPQERYEYIGNTSLTGAYMTLLSKEARDRLEEIRGSMTYIELSAHPGYMDEFVAACFLPHTDASLFPAAP